MLVARCVRRLNLGISGLSDVGCIGDHHVKAARNALTAFSDDSFMLSSRPRGIQDRLHGSQLFCTSSLSGQSTAEAELGIRGQLELCRGIFSFRRPPVRDRRGSMASSVPVEVTGVPRPGLRVLE
jgi:hypothetical protein